MKRFLIFLPLILALNQPVVSQQNHVLSVSTVPYGTVPLGSSTALYNLGFGVEASVSFIPSFFKYIGIGAGGDFILLPLESQDSIWALSGSGGPVFRLPLGDRFALHAYGSIGYYYWGAGGWDTDGGNGGGLVAGGGAGGSFRLAGPFALGLGVAYDYYSKLYNGFSFSLAIRLDFPVTASQSSVREQKDRDIRPNPLKEEGKGVEIRDISIPTLFPVLYKYYDNNPVGTARVINFEDSSAENLKISFYVDRYMDNPMQIGSPFSLDPGQVIKVDLFGLFTEDLMDITEGTKASAKINISYTQEGEDRSIDYTPVLEFHNRNALVWDDDRKIASFITAKDPEILSFSKNVVSWMKEVQNPAVDENLQKAMALFEAVKSYGVQYEIDPTTPFSIFSEEETAIDFLQFPRQTLRYTNGDCDDLSALYTSMLEAVGVETAVITIPGHIYTAFALEASPGEARRTFDKPDELIITGDTVWVPVEITMFQQSFAQAWQTGAKEWRENNSNNQANLYPTRDSWQIYQAVGFKEEGSGISLPAREEVTEAFRKCVHRHVEREIYPQVAAIESRLKNSQDTIPFLNKLAVVYARYGLYDRALENFRKIVEQKEYVPALINIGNIYFLWGQFENALSFYQRAVDRNSRNQTALLGIARCNHELENYGLVGKTYQQLMKVDPELAQRFAYLDLRGEEATRAANASGEKETVLWEEEEL